MKLAEFFDKIGAHPETIVLVSLAIILISGFLVTRITKLLKLPNVTGFIVAGILIGPYVFDIIPHNISQNMSFISDLALSLIAFSVGRFFKKEAFKETGIGIVTITLLESLLPGLLVTLIMVFVVKLDWDFAFLLGAIATATAPASTMATIRQYHARGKFVNTLLQVVAFDDAVALIVFSIATAVIGSRGSTDSTFNAVVLPIIYNIAGVALGVFSGFLLSKIVTPRRSEDNRLILTIAILSAIGGICAIMDVSPLLACMAFGTTYINLTEDKELYRQLEKFAPPILSIFFILSGMRLDITSFATLGVIGIVYFAVRIIGKYVGAFLGAWITKTEKEIRNYLGFALVPQAGVAIGLAFLGYRILYPTSPEHADQLLTIILSSSVLYELVGPISAKFALVRSGAIKPERLQPKKVINKKGGQTQIITPSAPSIATIEDKDPTEI